MSNFIYNHIQHKMNSLEHYLARSHEWFEFMLVHPEFRTRRIVLKLYERYMLSLGHTKILLDNLNENN